MKYGLLINEMNKNIGDDIQAYAEAQFLPRIDVNVNREHLNTFKYGDGTEPVALIMGAWFMWRKWNWPPSHQIVPLNIGYHHFDRNPELAKSSSSAVAITDQHYTGVGGDWFRAYGPVGCRDTYTCDVFDKNGIPNYFSGCVTLTLPKQPETSDKGSYIVCVDLNRDVEKKVIKLTQGQVEVRKVTHATPNINGATWEERKERVEKLLTLYQNARYVVTRRLHVALPCLAMGVPVMVIQSVAMNDPNRFDPYKKWLHYCRNTTFLKQGYDGFDFVNGTPNSTEYLPYREQLIKSMTEFVAYCEENADKDVDFFNKTTYTEDESIRWRERMLSGAIARTHKEQKELHTTYRRLMDKLRKTQETDIITVKVENQELWDKVDSLEKQLDDIRSSGLFKVAWKFRVPIKAAMAATQDVKGKIQRKLG